MYLCEKPAGLSTEDKEVTMEDGQKTKTVLEIFQSGTLHLIDDSGVEIYYNGTYFITSKEGHHEY
jgi:hypothetical protein